MGVDKLKVFGNSLELKVAATTSKARVNQHPPSAPSTGCMYMTQLWMNLVTIWFHLGNPIL
jgi:hypothetical protein